MQSMDEIKEAFDLVDDWEDRYQLIIDLGKSLPHMPAELKNDSNKVEGCVSQVWLVSEREGDRLHFQADSDAHIVRGLIGLLLMAFQDKPPEDILDVDIEAEFQNLGLEKHLSPNRRNGFYAMVGRIREMANLAAA